MAFNCLCPLEFADVFGRRSTQVSSGWYKGFGNLLKQEVADIGPSNVNVLSPSICVCCPTGGDAADTLTQKELYDRMDLVCAAGITDFSVFTFFEMVQGPQGKKDPQFGQTLEQRYFDAFYYFRTGKKKL